MDLGLGSRPFNTSLDGLLLKKSWIPLIFLQTATLEAGRDSFLFPLLITATSFDIKGQIMVQSFPSKKKSAPSVSICFLPFFSRGFIKNKLFFKHAKHNKTTQKLHFGLLLSSSLQRKKAELLSPAQHSEGVALEQPSGEGRALLSADGALIGNRNEKYFPESVWHYGSLVWNQLGRGQGLWLVSPCNVNFSLLKTSQLILRNGSVPRKLFVMI